MIVAVYVLQAFLLELTRLVDSIGSVDGELAELGKVEGVVGKAGVVAASWREVGTEVVVVVVGVWRGVRSVE